MTLLALVFNIIKKIEWVILEEQPIHLNRHSSRRWNPGDCRSLLLVSQSIFDATTQIRIDLLLDSRVRGNDEKECYFLKPAKSENFQKFFFLNTSALIKWLNFSNNFLSELHSANDEHK